MSDNHPTSSSLYPPLPAHIQNDLKRLDLKPLECSADKYVESFLKRSLPQKLTKNYTDLNNTLMRKGVMLDKAFVVKPKRKKKTKRLSVTEKKQLNVYNIAVENQKYELYLPLHNLWKDYIRDLLDMKQQCNMKMAYSKLLKADYHGCLITVSKSKCPSYVGTRGIVLQENRNVLKIITEENQLKSIPKANNVFTFDLDGYVFTLYGNQFCYRASDRAARKYKVKSTVDL